MVLARMITRQKWRPKDGLAFDEGAAGDTVRLQKALSTPACREVQSPDELERSTTRDRKPLAGATVKQPIPEFRNTLERVVVPVCVDEHIRIEQVERGPALLGVADRAEYLADLSWLHSEDARGPGRRERTGTRHAPDEPEQRRPDSVTAHDVVTGSTV